MSQSKNFLVCVGWYIIYMLQCIRNIRVYACTRKSLLHCNINIYHIFFSGRDISISIISLGLRWYIYHISCSDIWYIIYHGSIIDDIYLLYDKYITLECSLIPFSVSSKCRVFCNFYHLLFSYHFHVWLRSCVLLSMSRVPKWSFSVKWKFWVNDINLIYIYISMLSFTKLASLSKMST